MYSYRIMSVVGSAVPERLRDLGLLVCWYVVFEAEVISPPLMSRAAAQQHLDRLQGELAA